MDAEGELPDTAQALSVLEKAFRDALAVVPLEQVLQQVTVMFPRAHVEVDAGQGRLHSRAQKVSVSMPEDLITAVRDRTGPGGFSRYVTDAVERRHRQDLLAELDDWLEARYGPIPAEYLEQAEREWPDFDEE